MYLHAYGLLGRRAWARRVASRRVEPGVRNAFWDSAKSTVILIRVATGRHLNARAHARGTSHGGYYTAGFLQLPSVQRAIHRGEQDW